MSELILAASGARTAISEKFQTDPTNTASMGTGVTITVTPTANTSTGTLIWSCSGTLAKYMPATCR